MKLEYIKDIFGSNYIGLVLNSIYKDSNEISIDDYLDKLADLLGGDYFEMHDKLLERNDNKYHITLFNVQEYSNPINKYVLDNLVTSGCVINDIVFDGIGSISKGDMITYYIIVKSEQMNKLRDDFNFNIRHFHITVAFNHKDLFHIIKDDNTKIINKI